MGIKTLKPTTAPQRFTVLPDFQEITKDFPEKSLLVPLKKTGGRNNRGRITSRRHGGGHKQMYRLIDFKRNKFDIPGKVIAIEYDPGRTARIALIEYPDKERRYIILPKDLKVGNTIISAANAQTEINPGNAMKLEYIPLGSTIHNIELHPQSGATFVRSAGSSAQLMAKEKGFAQIRMPSGEIRTVSLQCRATIGQIGFEEHASRVYGKAGRRRWLGKRPEVRGVAMNPIDHPHGGGEGKAGQGNPHPVTPWGKPTKGGKTRRPKNKSNRYIIRRRK